jgi:hypothetical protein
VISALLAPALKYVCGALLFLTLVLGIALKVERVHSHKLDKRIVELTAELKSLSTAKNDQKVETVKRIEAVKERVRHADDRAKVIEQAPLPGQCKTPPEIMSADL